VFIAQDTDLTVGVQTTGRAPFVSLFSGDSTVGREHGSEGFLEAKSAETHKDVRSTGGNNSHKRKRLTLEIHRRNLCIRLYSIVKSIIVFVLALYFCVIFRIGLK